MTVPSAPFNGHPQPNPAGDHLVPPAEAAARRLLGLDAGWCVATGLVLLVLGRPVAGQVRLPVTAVRAAGAATTAWGFGVGVSSVAEDWQAVTRAVVGANVGATAGLLGLTAAKGRPLGRVLTAALAGQVGAFAYRQVQTLLEADGGVVA